MRPADMHLTPQELESLLFGAGDSNNINASGAAAQAAQQHLSGCAVCQSVADRYRKADRALKSLGSNQNARRTLTHRTGCPAEEVWPRVAVGLIQEEKAAACVAHAAQCDWCGPLLKESMENLTQDATIEEQQILERLPSSKAAWQRELGKRLAAANVASVSKHDRQVRDKVKTGFGLWSRFILAAGSLAAVVAIGWVTWQRQKEPDVNQLLAQAYTEQRTMEARMEGARYARRMAVRGENESPAPSLLRAKALIIERLRQHPDDVRWLRAEGQAALLDDDFKESVSALEKASRLAPDDPKIAIDLASAYILRADRLSREIDFSQAADLLGKVLAKYPSNQVATFNLAIAYERLHLYHDAEQMWQKYLELDQTSGWADEARDRLGKIRERTLKQKEKSQKPLLSPKEVSIALLGEDETKIKEIDARVERYLALAIEEWIPRFYSPLIQSEGNQRDLRSALDGLARLMAKNHEDDWLQDFIAEADHTQAARAGLVLLAEAMKMDGTTDLDAGRRLALGAAREFKKNGSSAGEMRALFEITYVDQLTHATGRCEMEAKSLGRTGRIRVYAWLRTQVLLEAAACANMSEEIARNLARQALELARRHKYGGLELRASNFLSVLYGIVGDPVAAWQYAGDGLRSYWDGDYESMRGYSLCAGLDHVAEESQQSFLDVALLREALGMIADDPDKLLRAMEHERMAQASLLIGDLQSAESNFEATQRLFLESAEGARKKNLQVEAQIGLASVELLRAQAQDAIARLEKIRTEVERMQDKDIRFDFLRTSGMAFLEIGARKQAENDLAAALTLAEESLLRNTNERERLTWSRKTAPAYRGMVELKLEENPGEAFMRWEWYKGASLRWSTRPADAGLPENVTISALSSRGAELVNRGDTAVVSYALFPKGIAIWVYDTTGTKLTWVAATKSEVELQARIFSEHCADRYFDVASLRRESSKLYQRIFLPIEPLVGHRKHITIETDEALALVPFEALVDNEGLYLGDRWQVSFSPGLDYLVAARSWGGISPASHALVVAVPLVRGWQVLPEAKEEADSVAAFFHHPHRLLNGEAVPETVIRELSLAEIFHFAGHATASAAGVGLVLGDASLLDVSTLDRAAFRRNTLVVLSACSSADGAAGVFTDRDSLARQFVSRGVPEVVASRWLVDSKATAELMKTFYESLSRGVSVSEALQRAARALRAQQGFSHPFYWAGFSVFGRG